MSAGVPGQAPEMNLPPLLVQLEVEMQTPGAPSAPEHGSFTGRTPRTTSEPVATEKKTPNMSNGNIVILIFRSEKCSEQLQSGEQDPR